MVGWRFCLCKTLVIGGKITEVIESDLLNSFGKCTDNTFELYVMHM